MTTGLLVAVVLGLSTFLFKAAGPLALGSRQLPPIVQRLALLLPAALLAALVVASTVGAKRSFDIDARIVGVAAAAAALWRGANFVVVVLVAAATTAVTRALGWK